MQSWLQPDKIIFWLICRELCNFTQLNDISPGKALFAAFAVGLIYHQTLSGVPPPQNIVPSEPCLVSVQTAVMVVSHAVMGVESLSHPA